MASTMSATTAAWASRRGFVAIDSPGGVVISHSLGVAVSLQHGVGLHHLILKGGLLLLTLLWLLP